MAIAEWKYPFPSRTRKSSALTPMVLQRCGRVGSRQALFFALRRPAGASLRPSVRSRARSTVPALPPCAASQHASEELHPSCILVIPWSILPASCAMHPWPFRSICGVRSGCSIRSVRHVRPIRCIRPFRRVALSAFGKNLEMRTIICPLFPKKQKCGHFTGVHSL